MRVYIDISIYIWHIPVCSGKGSVENLPQGNYKKSCGVAVAGAGWVRGGSFSGAAVEASALGLHLVW